jgi:acetyl-CoA carboxylase beta subunit
MDGFSFIVGGMTVLLGYVFLSIGMEDGGEEVEIVEPEMNNLVVNGFAGRHVMMSCQTCRKLKKHREIKTDLYQCIKCKRHTDLRRAS